MDSFLSSIIADLVMQDLESVTLESLFFNLPFYYRYVDHSDGSYEFLRFLELGVTDVQFPTW